MNKDSPLKDSTRRYLTRALFVELTTDKETEEKYPPRCTLKEAHDLYMELADPTEYEFAKALLESDYTNFWDHWRRLLDTPDFMFYLEKWREELEIQIRSRAISQMISIAGSRDKGAAVAAKWVAERGWEPKKRAGRPNKDTAEKERRTAEALTSTVNDDAKRIDLATNG
jgi:hypothetical protein